MRRASDLPRRGGRRTSGRVVLIGIGVLFLLVVVFGRAVARFYVDFLWHAGLLGDDLSPVVLILVAPQGGQVTATLSPVEQDADLGNNTWRADLG